MLTLLYSLKDIKCMLLYRPRSVQISYHHTINLT
uniref:Uncharacterized protein n=1 Tax=Rhizophora mucronata TaxID=61149 RepID=A0A2P2N513_RHIMU